MPELPEVETVRLGLAEQVTGRRIDEAIVTGRRTVRRQSPAELVERLTGRRIEGARRRGKYLFLDLDDGAVLVVHLRMSGQLRVLDCAEPIVLHTHVRLRLDDGRELRFVDPRTFGELFVTEDLDLRRVPSVLSELGVDPIIDGVDPKLLQALLAGRRTLLKSFLLDQHAICGIGNIYADEICFRARVSPLRKTESLKRGEVQRLAEAIPEVLGAAVTAGGSTLRDARYLDLAGAVGSYQEHHAVYDRYDQPCIHCSGTIRRAKVAGRSTHYCSRCQR